MRLPWLLLLLCSACNQASVEGGPLFGEDPNRPLDLRAEISSNEVELLAEFELRIDLYRDAEQEIDFSPEIPDGCRGEIRVAEERAWADGFWRAYRLTLRPTAVGELTIPSYRVSPGDGEEGASTAEFLLQVSSLLGGGDSPVEAPAELFPSRVQFMPWIVGGLTAIVLLGLLVFWWRRVPKDRRPVGGIALPAHTKALRALARLRNEPRTSDLEIEAFYQRVSAVLREYLEDRFGLHAPDRTTEEFLPEVESSGLLASEQQQHLSQFLSQCDLVKFARLLPAEPDHVETFEFAERLVEETREDRQEVMA